jgi:hypothetical protein
MDCRMKAQARRSSTAAPRAARGPRVERHASHYLAARRHQRLAVGLVLLWHARGTKNPCRFPLGSGAPKVVEKCFQKIDLCQG